MADLEKINKVIRDVEKSLHNTRSRLGEVAESFKKAKVGSEEQLALQKEGIRLQKRLNSRLELRARLEDMSLQVGKDELEEKKKATLQEIENRNKSTKSAKTLLEVEKKGQASKKKVQKSEEEVAKANEQLATETKKAAKKVQKAADDTVKQLKKNAGSGVFTDSRRNYYNKQLENVRPYFSSSEAFDDFKKALAVPVGNDIKNKKYNTEKGNFSKTLFKAGMQAHIEDMANAGSIKTKQGSTAGELVGYTSKLLMGKSYDAPSFNTSMKGSNTTPVQGNKETKIPEKVAKEDNKLKEAKEREIKVTEAVTEEKTRTINFEAAANRSLQIQSSTIAKINANLEKLSESIEAQTIYGRQFATVLVKAVRGVGKINLPSTLGSLDSAAKELTEQIKQTRPQLRTKSEPDGSMYGDPTQGITDEVKLHSGKPRSSFVKQEAKNQKRQEQKGFIALLIPALAKLLKKSPIWDAIKLLLLKFGASHPLLASGALLGGPALLASGIGMKLMGGFGKGAGQKLATGASKLTRSATVYGSKYATKTAAAVGSAESGIGEFITDMRALGSARANVAKAERVRGNLGEIHDWAKADANFAEQALHRARNSKGPKSKLAAAKLQNKEAQLALSNVNQQMRTAERIHGNLTAKMISMEEQLTEKYLGRVKTVFKNVSDGFKGTLKSTKEVFKNMKSGWASIGKNTVEFFNKIKAAGIKGNIASIGKGFAKGAGAAGKGLWAATKPSTALKALGKFGKGAKFLGPLGIGIAALAEVPDLVSAATSGKPGAFKKQLAKSGGGVTGSIVGAGVGMTLGSVIGPVGTAIGGALGAIIGDIAGRILGPAFMDGFGVFGKDFKKDFVALWDGLKKAFGGVMKVVVPIATFIGRMLVPTFKLLGFVLGGLVKVLTWGLNIVGKILGWIGDTIGNIADTIVNAIKGLWEGLKKIPLLGPVVKQIEKLYGTSGDKDNNNSSNGSTAGNAANTAQNTGGGSSAPAKQGNTNFDNLVKEEREKMKKEGTDETLRDPDKVATLHAINKLNTYTTNGINNTVDMRDLGLYGRVDGDNSKPYIPQQNALKLKNLDDTLAKWGYGVVYTSNMGGNHANGSGHYSGNKVDLQLTKNGKAAHLTQDQLNELQRQGYWGNGTGAVGWEAVNGQVGGGHYDLYVAPGTGKKTGTSTGTATGTDTTTSTAVNQQTDDGVREALLKFANSKNNQPISNRDLIFQATDVTGSLGCWGITHVNNTGQMIH